MNERIEQLINNNRRWAKKFAQNNPGIFNKLAEQQKPDYLWIGCSDSRVPANTIIGLQPGEVFVHRNVANLVNHSDLNVLTVLEFAVKILGITDIILCGHYGCSGVAAALDHEDHGIIDEWICSIKDTHRLNQIALDKITDNKEKVDRLCELNVVEQVRNICRTSTVQNAWSKGQKLAVHGLIYGIEDGLIKDLDISARSVNEIDTIEIPK